LSFDTAGYGYGPASLSHLLRVDPTQHPDTNPLLNKPNGLGVPTAAEFAAAANGSSPKASASPSTAAAAPSPGKASGSIMPGLLTEIVIAVIAVLLLLIAAAVALVVVVRRRNRTWTAPE